MSTTIPALSIIMPCHNRAHDLSRVLAAYDAQTGAPNFEVIAVDDASTDGTRAVLEGYRPSNYQLRLETLPTNQGPAAARNRGIALAAGPIIAFVGDDIVPGPEFVRGHLLAHQTHPEPHAAILGRVEWPADLPQNTLMKHIDGVGAQQFSYYYLQDGHVYDYRHLYTANVSLKTDFLKSLPKWFDTGFKYAAFEDAELGYRLAQRGLVIHYVANICVDHYHYHTIWSFSRRQYVCGLMAFQLVKRHPSTALQLLTRGHLKTALLALLYPTSIKAAGLARLEQAALHSASLREWQPQPPPDGLYARILNYFYLSGLLDGVFGPGPLGQKIHLSFGEQSLKHLSKWSNSA